jgi:hypothetical protein
MTLRCAAASIFAGALIAHSSAADTGAALAAPGDCATPIGDFVAPLVYGQSAGVPGPVSDHFAPRGGTTDALSLLPIDLTRTTTDAVSGSVSLVQSTTGEVTDAVGSTVSGVGGLTSQTLDNLNGGGAPLGTEPITDLGTQAVGVVGDGVRSLLGGHQ